MSQYRLAFPEVAVDFMNHDHHEFAALREKLLAVIAAGSAASGIEPLLDELHSHTVRHFADEEKLMQDTGFPVYPVHKGEHDSVLADLAARIAHWRQGGDVEALRNWLDMAVGDRLVAHVNSMDMVTAGYAAARQPK